MIGVPTKLPGLLRCGAALVFVLVVAAACAHGNADQSLPPLEPGDAMQDDLHGLVFELPKVEGGWQTSPEGTRLAKDVRVEVGSFPLARPGNVAACRDSARARLSALQKAAAEQEAEEAKEAKEAKDEKKSDAKVETTAVAPPPLDLPRDQKTDESPAPSWSFTRGEDSTAVRSRWAFFARGSDCLLIEVTGPLGGTQAERVFQHAVRTAHTVPISAEQQREIDVRAGMGFLQQRDPASALERFDSLAKREPSFAVAHYGALMAAFEIGPPAYGRGLPHGVAALSNERELSADQRQLALSAVGVMQLSQDKLKDAAQTLSELVVRAPELAEGQYNYACALARLGDAPAAVEHLRAAIALEGNLAEHARGDEDLKSLRGQPGFEQALKPGAMRK
jgi:tetratricopeptide (TPR) repeat protein